MRTPVLLSTQSRVVELTRRSSSLVKLVYRVVLLPDVEVVQLSHAHTLLAIDVGVTPVHDLLFYGDVLQWNLSLST